MQNTAEMYGKFVDEYTSEDAVRKYTTETAGYGITYLLSHDYAQIYLDAVKLLRSRPARPVRLLEFGCGGGMNITRLISLLNETGVRIDRAYGADFSPRLVQAAQHESEAFLTASLREKLSFHVARNEKLAEDLAAVLGRSVKELVGSFDLIVGVNTFRYCHRLHKEEDCAADIYRLLRPGGVCVIIDMNDRFPAFRSRFKAVEQDPLECYLPSLEEYTRPFKNKGFEVVRNGNFCWTPHSAGRMLATCSRLAGPFLNLAARSRAMRSLVIARKPA